MLICNKNLTELGFMLLCGFCFVAECILLLVVGSGHDTVRFSLSFFVHFSCWQRNRKGEREK